MTQSTTCSNVAFAEMIKLEFTECNSRCEEYIKKTESFLETAKSIQVPRHLEHIRWCYIHNLEKVLRMAHKVDAHTAATERHLKKLSAIVKKGVSVETHNACKDCLDTTIQLIHKDLNNVENYLNDLDNIGSRALNLANKVDMPCGIRC